MAVAQMMCGVSQRTTAGISSRNRLRSEEHTSELQSQFHLVCRLLREKKKPIPTGSSAVSGRFVALLGLGGQPALHTAPVTCAYLAPAFPPVTAWMGACDAVSSARWTD